MIVITEVSEGVFRHQTVSDKPSRVEQHHKNDVNINSIMAKFVRTGLLPQRGDPGHYGDFTGVSDFQTCQNALVEARKAFMGLPSQIRKRFKNDPHKLLTFLEDPGNKEEAIKLGIIPTPPTGPAGQPETEPEPET